MHVFINDVRDSPFIFGPVAGTVAAGAGCIVIRLAAGDTVDVRAYENNDSSTPFLSGDWDYLRIHRL